MPWPERERKVEREWLAEWSGDQSFSTTILAGRMGFVGSGGGGAGDLALAKAGRRSWALSEASEPFDDFSEETAFAFSAPSDGKCRTRSGTPFDSKD